jgi:hypothetical protein
MLWRLGHRIDFPARSRLLGIFAVVTAPMFLRAFMTDYPEHFIIWGSMILMLLVFSSTASLGLAKSSVIGVFAASLVIANPFTTIIIVIVLSVGLIFVKTSGVSWNSLIKNILAVSLSATALIIIGYLLFEYHYKIGNVYQPTLDFVRAERPTVDGWTAPNNKWLHYFPWLYICPSLVISVYLMFSKFEEKNKRIIKSLASIAALTFMAHVYFEIRRGNALETSYYWSMSLGPVLILVFVILGQLAKQTDKKFVSVTAVSFIFVVFLRLPQSMKLPFGSFMYMCILLTFIGICLLTCRYPSLGPTLFVFAITWVQIGGPTYTVLSNAGELNTPRYDLVYNSPLYTSDLILNETIWFLDQMDDFKNDWQSVFLTAGGWSSAIVGTYIPHPFSRWIVPFSDSRVLAPNMRDELEFGYRPLLVIFGDTKTVQNIATKLNSELSSTKVLKDITHSTGLGYRLVVLQGNTKTTGMSTIPVARLDRNIGTPREDGSVFVRPENGTGFVSFGPYFGLGSGSYTATLEFISDDRGGVGYFEVYSDKTQRAITTTVESNSKGPQKATIRFDVTSDSSTWQLRTVYQGKVEVSFDDIVLQKLK